MNQTDKIRMETQPTTEVVDGAPDESGGDRNMAEEMSVKQEIPEKEKEVNAGVKDIKTEPVESAAGDADSSGRSMRKRSMNSMAETSDFSEESADENFSKPAKKRRGGSGSANRTSSSRGRSKGKGNAAIPANLADPSRNPRIVLKNVDDRSTPEQGRAGQGEAKPAQTGRARRGRPPKSATKAAAKSTPKKRARITFKDDDDDEEEDGFELDDEEEEEEEYIPKKKRGARQSKATPKRAGKGRGKGNKPVASENEEDDDDEDDEEGGATHGGAGDANAVNPDAITTGQYLMEKADMRRLENYPIWRMEGPNMLRKFEMTVVDGRVCHKSMYAYSSWAQSMLDLYEKLEVKQISSQDGETIVEITEEFMPKPPELASLENLYAADVLLPLYQKYIQALFHQAVDPAFLKKIKQENDFYFLDAINQIDNIVREKITHIESQVSMKEDFKARVRNCPNMKSIRRQNWSQTDQATTNKSSEKGVRSVLLYGYGYEPFTMEEDKSKGVEVAQEAVVGSTMDQYLAAYHGLIHFKYTLLKRCQDKVKLCRAIHQGHEMGMVLNRCLQDRVWILQTYEDMKALLSVGSVS